MGTGSIPGEENQTLDHPSGAMADAKALEVDFVGLCAKLGPLGGWEISDQ